MQKHPGPFAIVSSGYESPWPEFPTFADAMRTLREWRANDLAAARRCWSVNAKHVTANFTNPERTAYSVDLGVNRWISRAIVPA